MKELLQFNSLLLYSEWKVERIFLNDDLEGSLHGIYSTQLEIYFTQFQIQTRNK